MVYYKRKPIVLPTPQPLPSNINVNVWHIYETGEWFLTYTEYLERMDFYLSHQFTCEITGTSFLTFFEALNSEETQFRLVEEKFPLKLREPVAKFMHFNEIKRVDLLVERVYARFKTDFYPGERVYVRRKNEKLYVAQANTDETGEQLAPMPAGAIPHVSYIVKEKASFNAVVDLTASEVVKPAFSKYMITEEFGVKSLMVEENDIFRDRSTFTKHLIKCFCKITLRRASSKLGAPLCVRDEYLPMYGLTLDWPTSMQKYRDDFNELRQGQVGHNQEQSNNRANETTSRNAQAQTSKRSFFDGEKNPEAKKKSKNSGPSPSPSQPNEEPIDHLPPPYIGPNRALENAFYYNEHLESVPVCHSGVRFAHMYKLLEVYQFCQTFSKVLVLAPFGWDTLIKSIKCSDFKNAFNVTVHVDVHHPLLAARRKKENEGADYVSSSVLEHRIERVSPGLCKYFEDLGSQSVSYKLLGNQTLLADVIDSTDTAGASLMVECFIALERLFIAENGDWRCLVMDKWYDEDELTAKTNRETGDSVKPKENGNKDEDDLHDPEIFDLLERCLNFRKVSWTERLSKRQFKNGFWIIILLGIYQDCMHLPMYTPFVHKFIKAVVPADGSATHLNKALWRNFCQNLSLEDKVYALWILVDMASNFSQDIKNFIEDTLDVCTQIRSEKLKLSKRLKTALSSVGQLSSTNIASVAPNNELSVKLDHQHDLIDRINRDRDYLTQKLIENDVRRLKSLGTDRNGNKYYWQELSGVQRDSPNGNGDLGSNRLWVRGPSKKHMEDILKIPQETIKHWKQMVDKMPIEQAALQVFKVERDKDNVLTCGEGQEKTTLVYADCTVNESAIKSSAFYRKLVDERSNALLLGENSWVSIERPQDVEELIGWLSADMSVDPTLVKQLRAIKKSLLESINKRWIDLVNARSTEDDTVQKQVIDCAISEEDLQLGQVTEVDENAAGDEEELERIAHEIMELDDSSKTRVSLNRIRELEERRDYLLNARTFNDHAIRINSRNQRKKKLDDLETRLNEQEVALTSYVNFKIQNVNPEKVMWMNEVAYQLWKTSLYLGASGKPITQKKCPLKQEWPRFLTA
ncbi:LADA_0G01838g1_1 [Lachancea dasiensis]|uniref:LADA_0G01838g1_1 n=1 Tax=Lachancea dasiensis TaxID=1072105 RepID=A0A1G4JQV9_9SACH|nr:LADA_0G01838g1_1 [Lachancea dasiensis]